MKLSFLFFTFTLLLLACGKRNTTGKNYCPKRAYVVTKCMRMYAYSYGYDYANEYCKSYGDRVACR